MSRLTKKEIKDLLNFDDGDFLVFDLDATVAMNEAVLHQLTQPLVNNINDKPKADDTTKD